VRKIKGLPSKEGEEIILSGQGAYKYNLRSGWRLGHFYLTTKRLLFSKAINVVFEVPLELITAVTLEKQGFVFRQRKVICLLYKSVRTGKVSKAWIIMAGLESWRKKIYEMTQMIIDEETINRIAGRLDEESKEILWYLWQNEYAKINELAELIRAPTHMDVLLKIREIMNPIAEKMVGGPILTFEKSKIDPGTGEKILFSWWIAGKRSYPPVRGRERLLDIFDEVDYIAVIMELAGIQKDDILLKVEGKRLIVSTQNSDKRIPEEIYLPAEVNPEGLTKRYNNDILEVRVQKARNNKTSVLFS